MQIASITTNEEGEYEYTAEEDYTGQTLDYVIQKEGFIRQDISHEIDRFEIKSDFLMDKIEIKIKGKTCDKAGNPVANVSVSFSIGGSTIDLESDKDGSFSFTFDQQFLNQTIGYEANKEGFKITSGKLKLIQDLGCINLSEPIPIPDPDNRWIIVAAVGIILAGVAIILIPPELSTDPYPMDFYFEPGTGAQTFSIWNDGYMTLDWDVYSDQDWIIVSPDSGTDDGTVSVIVNSAGMDPGRHTGIITVESNGGTETGTISLYIREPPRIHYFNADPEYIDGLEGETTLSWKVSGATTVTIDGVGPVDVSEGSINRWIEQTTNFTLRATNDAGVSDVRETTVYVKEEPPRIHYFKANLEHIDGPEGETTLSWEVTDATDVTIDQGIERVESEGEEVISSLNETTTFTLTATNEVGSVSEEVEVIVLYPIFSNSGRGTWQYYKDITISNTGGDLTDYQVLVHLDGKIEHAKDNGADIRFSNVEGTELNNWIEDWYSTGNDAKIWVKVPSVPADRSTRIRMYYGNPKAFSTSDGDATFDFFDDFSKTTLKSDWFFFNPRGDDAVSLTEKPGWIRIKVRGDSDTWDKVNEAPFVYTELDDENYIIQTKEDGGDVGPRQHSLLAYMRTFKTGSQYKGYFGAFNSQTSVKFEADGYRGTNCETRETIHYLRFRIFDSRLYYDWSNNGIDWNRCSSYESPSRPTLWGLGGKSWSGGGSFNADFDYFIVRKYAEPEPTVRIEDIS